jgi:hypothetical protein
MNSWEQQAWNDHLGNLFIEPDETVVMHCGRDWCRTHAMRCAVCEKVFFGYEQVAHPRTPYENRLGDICGHPLCVASKEREFKETNSEYRNNCQSFYTSKAANAPPPQDKKKELNLTGIRSASKIG